MIAGLASDPLSRRRRPSRLAANVRYLLLKPPLLVFDLLQPQNALTLQLQLGLSRTQRLKRRYIRTWLHYFWQRRVFRNRPP